MCRSLHHATAVIEINHAGTLTFSIVRWALSPNSSNSCLPGFGLMFLVEDLLKGTFAERPVQPVLLDGGRNHRSHPRVFALDDSQGVALGVADDDAVDRGAIPIQLNINAFEDDVSRTFGLTPLLVVIAMLFDPLRKEAAKQGEQAQRLPERNGWKAEQNRT